MGINCDFSGWATRNDLLCGDGRTIRKDAFAQNDGCQVPLVWNHKHDDVNAVLGHAVLYPTSTPTSCSFKIIGISRASSGVCVTRYSRTFGPILRIDSITSTI